MYMYVPSASPSRQSRVPCRPVSAVGGNTTIAPTTAQLASRTLLVVGLLHSFKSVLENQRQMCCKIDGCKTNGSRDEPHPSSDPTSV